VTPQRAGSSIAKLIDRLSAQSYSKLIKAINPPAESSPGKGKLTARQVKEYIEKYGRPGAYEDLCESAKEAEHLKK